MRAMVVFERQPDASWKPVTVYQATKNRLFGKTLPGNALRSDALARLLGSAQAPMADPFTHERGTMEDWIGWALDAMSNGQTAWTSEVKPELSVDQLYQREVLEVAPQPLVRPDLRPTVEAPVLVGRKRPGR